MTYLNEIKGKHRGLTSHIVKTEKFKTVSIIFKMLAPLTKEDVTERALFPHVLLRGTGSRPKTSELRTYLDELYGTSVSCDLSKKGEMHVITFRLDIANEKFLKDQTPLLEKGLELLSEIIFSPALEDGAFLPLYVSQEKRTLKQRIQAVYNDKMRYSNLRLIQVMCKEEPYALHVNGELDDVDGITPQSLYEAYQKAVTEDQLDIYVVGDVDEKQVNSYISKYFEVNERELRPVPKLEQIRAKEPQEVVEDADVKQGKLNMGFRTGTHFTDDDYPALQLFNGLFGGFSHSKLFINVREKASLAYYAASRIESFKGLLMVMSGIEVGNYQKAVDIIKEQFQEMKKGSFTEEAIDQTKAVIKNQILETLDTPYGLVEFIYQQAAAQTEFSLEDWLGRIDNVTKAEIIEVGKKIDLDTTYFLKGTEGAS
ncbi:EF-P 5-aminopentanol modification-associated protein YfmF [Bacillus paralicheniformis]|uniref:EF-P 5-aminopentanol modification-associated protein YfmF n=2 Tax=Bacillus paralicheniformis TaxID=1648923 RepID=UPI002242EE1F|nr:pitrilysin family protein [Bacillus paralicheniformis]MEC1021642.1 pitrilysin family protein [Bacillus paralicheniformis]MEC1025015.1 pitrilysin family protein [Bacillus paralicheniformis]MEC1033054.1 pitrilysin family protein [Bacillus paralicheniformis]MEC1051922.1 pitrilysin family protein [Bacillus paralicheniformis]MEC1061249.1 pitrilysin family protein [Bacillus paralicheniformis]